MTSEQEAQSRIALLRRRLRPLRRWLEYYRRALLTTGFRLLVDVLRRLQLLPKAASPQDAPYLLVANLTPHLGDSVMMIPLIEALRAALPKARLECAVEQSAAPLLRRLPELNAVHGLKLGNVPPLTLSLATAWAFRVVREYWRTMRGVHPTLCILPRWGDDQFRSDVLAYLLGAPTRIGFGWNVRHGALPAPYRDALLTRLIPGGTALHEPVRFCLLAVEANLLPRSMLDGLSRKVVPALQRVAAVEDWPALARRLSLDITRAFAVLAPGASHPKKMWPLAPWIEIMAELERRGLQLVLLSGPADVETARLLHERHGGSATLVAGTTTLLESLTLIAHAALFLGNDSGPAHMAGALGVPTVVVFCTPPTCDPDDPYSPARNGPLGPAVVCCQPPLATNPCVTTCIASEAHCIKNVAVGQVLAAVDEVLRLHASSALVSEGIPR